VKQRGDEKMGKQKKQNVNKQEKVKNEELSKKIEEGAYELYCNRGCQDGNDWSDWFEAEKTVLAQNK
jgi:hypothetical protein